MPTPNLKSFMAAVGEDPASLTTVNFMRKGWADSAVYERVRELRETQDTLLGGGATVGGSIAGPEAAGPTPQQHQSAEQQGQMPSPIGQQASSAASSDQDLSAVDQCVSVKPSAESADAQPLRAAYDNGATILPRSTTPLDPLPATTSLGFPPVADKKSFRLMTMSYDLAAKVVTVETDPHYFPAWRVESSAHNNQ